MMNEAKARLDEWAKFSPQLAYIAESLKQVMTPEIAGWIMKAGKNAKGLWGYIEAYAKRQRVKNAPSVLVTPPQMEAWIYDYLQQDDATTATAPTAIAPEPEDEDDGLYDIEAGVLSGQTSLLGIQSGTDQLTLLQATPAPSRSANRRTE